MRQLQYSYVWWALSEGKVHAVKNIVLVKNTFWFLVESHINLHVTWIPRELNQFADDLSKFMDTSDWMLHKDWFTYFDKKWGPFDIDLFASYMNHQVPRYYSRCHTPDCAGVDSFAHYWGRNCWANPPFSIMSRVLQHAEACKARVCLVMPFWITKPWWRKLTNDNIWFNKFVHGVFLINPTKDTFLPGITGNQQHKKAPMWPVLVLLIDFALDVKVHISVPPLPLDHRYN